MDVINITFDVSLLYCQINKAMLIAKNAKYANINKGPLNF